MIQYETELYPPVKRYLENAGYSVRGEVAHCDITALKDGELIAVELKKSLNLELILQGVDRQRKTDAVYIAVPRPDSFSKDKKWKLLIHLLRRLELGLIFVSASGYVEVAHHALPFDREKSRRMNASKRRIIIAEHSARSVDANTGGSTRKKLMTAYREQCIEVASYLLKKKSASPKEISAAGAGGKKTASILNKNYYGWFERIAPGMYALTKQGKKEAKEYIKTMKNLLKSSIEK